ncbi:hypothetical protein [Tessaracoccus lapidicaptus]
MPDHTPGVLDPSGPRRGRGHTSADLRLIVGDMLAKFALHERRISGAA